VVINACWGLGEGIVSGLVTPDSFVVAKGDLSLLERRIGPKELAVLRADAGGTVETELSPQRAESASITDAEAREIAALAMGAEAVFGSPQDIEWGIAGGDIYLLQSRPITTIG
jgi:pyruvate,water dikinase